MNRSQIEAISKEITLKYFKMLTEMSLSEITQPINTQNSANGYFYMKVNEISSRWISDEKPIWDTMSKLFVGLFSANVTVSVVFNNDGKETGVYIGCPYMYFNLLGSVIRGCFPQIQTTETILDGQNQKPIELKDILVSAVHGGYLKGNPTGSENYAFPFQIDSVIKGMAGKPWNIAVFAKPVRKSETVTRQQYWLAEASKCSELSEVSYSDNDNNVETVTYKKSYFHSEQYSSKVEKFSNNLTDSIAMGEWCVTINFSSDTAENVRMLGGLLTSAFFGEESEPEPVHAVYSDFSPFTYLVDGSEHCQNEYCEAAYPKYGSFLSSKELAIYSAFPTIDTAGFTVRDHVDFDVNREIQGDLEIGRILDSGKVTNNIYSINVNEFNRHCLIVGLTGSGKTNTIKSLICGLTKEASRPFMVIEPAKKEYWELYKLGYDNLQVYSVGSNDPGCHALCLNPFERTNFTDAFGNKRTVPIQTHIDFVYAAFKASFIMYTPMPYVLERSIYEIYEDCGWDIHNNLNKTGKEIYPTIEDLYFKIPEVVTDMGYDHKMRNDLIGSLQARINSMRLGSKGDTLNVRRSFPLDKLLNGNVVIELEDIGDDDVKAFIISLLLINLLEYRRQQEDCQLEVRHLMLIEEAHRLLKNVQSGTGENADPRGAAVEFFCNLLAELRSKGQGFIVADQIPSKLAPDLIKNTNLKITHRTVAADERELIGGAMHMTEEQIDSLSSLKQGIAAVYSEGDNRPKLVNPKYVDTFAIEGRKSLSREDVIAAVSRNCISAEGQFDFRSQTDLRNAICRKCNAYCEKQPRDILSRLDKPDNFMQFAEWLDPRQKKTCKINEIDANIKRFLSKHLLHPSENPREDENCVVNYLLDQWKLPKKLTDRIIRVYNNTREESVE